MLYLFIIIVLIIIIYYCDYYYIIDVVIVILICQFRFLYICGARRTERAAKSLQFRRISQGRLRHPGANL